MKKIMILSVLLFGLGAISLAATENKPKHPITTKYDVMRKQLNLTPMQFGAILSIEARIREQMPVGPRHTWTSMEVERASRLKAAERKAVQQVLTPAQRQQAKQLRPHLRPRRAGKANHAPRAPRPH